MKVAPFLLFFVLLFPITAKPCGFAPSDYDRFWFLQSEAANMQLLMQHTLEYTNLYWPSAYEAEENYQNQVYQKNLEEWIEITQQKVKKEDIHQVLYDMTPAVYFSQKASKNRFILWLKAHPEAKIYMDLAKRYEAIFNRTNDWENPTPFPTQEINALEKDLSTFAAKASSPTFKLRAYYLATKCSRNTDQIANAIQHYEKAMALKIKGTYIGGSLHYLRGAIESDSLKKIDYFAQAWLENGEGHIQMHQYLQGNERYKLIPQIKNPRHRAQLMAIYALGNSEATLDDLKAIAALDPSLPDLSFLLGRQINAFEDETYGEKVLHTSYSNFYDGAWEAKKSPKRDLKGTITWVQSMINSQKRADKPFWNLALAQLQFLDQQWPAVIKTSKVLPLEKYTPTQQLQMDIVVFFTNYFSKPSFDAATEGQFVELLKRADEHNNLAQENFYYTRNISQQLIAFVSYILQGEGKIAKAALIQGERGQVPIAGLSPYSRNLNGPYETLLLYGTPEQFEEAKRILTNPSSPLEKYIVTYGADYRYSYENEKSIWDEATQSMVDNPNYSLPQWNLDKIKDMESMYWMSVGDYEKARAVLQNISPVFWEKEGEEVYKDYFAGSPFSVELTPKELSSFPDKAPNDKRTFLDTYLSFSKQASSEKGIAAAAAYFYMANAEYNMAYPGRRWFLMSRPSKDYYEVGSEDEYGATPFAPTTPPYLSWLILLLFGSLSIYWFYKHPPKQAKMVTTAGLFLLLFSQIQCKKKDVSTLETSTKLEVESEAVLQRAQRYYTASAARELYAKAIEAAPNSEIAAASVHMIAKCDAAAVSYAEELQLPVPESDIAKWEKAAGKPANLSAAMMSCSEFKKFAKAKAW